MSGFYMKTTESEITKGSNDERAPDVTINRTFDGTFSTSIDDENEVSVTVPIDGYTLNKNVTCSSCKYFVEEKYGIGAWDIYPEHCTHKENNHYTYDYQGKHENLIWEPEDRNADGTCELWEKKISFVKKMQIKLNLF